VEDGEALVDKQLQFTDVIQELLVLKRELVIILQTYTAAAVVCKKDSLPAPQLGLLTTLPSRIMKATRGLNTGISLRRDRQWSTHVLAAVWVMAMIASLTVAVEASRLARGLSTSRGTAHFVTQTTLFQQNYQAFSDAKHAVLLAGGQQVQLVLDQQAGELRPRLVDV
jgi:hypothetical protein